MPEIPPEMPPEGSLRVLVVDDSEPNRRLAEILVRRRGLDVASAADGAAALDRLEEEPFDLVLLDVMMRGLDGPAVAREVRRREAAAGLEAIQIVAVTASVLAEDRARMLDAGMDDHLAKPLLADDLAALLDRRLPTGSVPRNAPIPGRSPAPASELPGDGPILDEVAFARLVELGDGPFVERIVSVFLADAAARVAEVDEAILDRDVERLRGALGTLEGIGALVGAAGLSRRVRAIQDEVQRREGLGADPFSPALGPSGLGQLMVATRIEIGDRPRDKDEPRG